MTAILAGLAYFATVFAIGFALGAIRTLFLAPNVGESAAVLIELPVILTASWFVSQRLIRKMSVRPAVAARVLMGAVALFCLLAADAALASVAFGISPDELIARYREAPGIVGLGGQIAFAAIPLIQGLVRRRTF